MSKDKFSIQLFESICEEIATSANSLATITAKHKVTSTSFYNWVAADKNLLDKYAHAKELQADFLAEQILDIADDSSQDTITVPNAKGKMVEVENKEWVNRSKLRVDARKWIASKLRPKKYGDNSTIELGVKKLGKDIDEVFE